jgi:transcriptional antiterminator RfaH
VSRWFVVHTQPNAEARALSHLSRQGYRVYLPTFAKRRSHARRVETVRRALFPRYLFVEMGESTLWRPILSTVGVADLVRVGDRPVAVPSGIVEALRSGEAERAFDEETAIRKLLPGQLVRILAGPFATLVGRFAAMAESDRVFVLLELLGREVRAKIPTYSLAPV